MTPFADLPLPVLTPPSGAKVQAGGSGSSVDSMSSQARIETSQTPREVSTHYLKQLEAAGWMLEGQVADGSAMVVARLSITTKAGDAATAILIVTALKGTPAQDLSLRIVRNNASGRGGATAKSLVGFGSGGRMDAPRR